MNAYGFYLNANRVAHSTVLYVILPQLKVLVETFQSVLLSADLDYLRTFYMLGKYVLAIADVSWIDAPHAFQSIATLIRCS